MARFRHASLEVHDLPVEVAASAMLQGTWSTPLQESLSLSLLMSLVDLFVRANKYILLTEVMKTIGGNEDRE